MIRAFLQVNCSFQVYTTQDTSVLFRAFLQVKGVFRHTAGLINVFLQVNCSFQVYTTQDSTAGLYYATQITKAQETRVPTVVPSMKRRG